MYYDVDSYKKIVFDSFLGTHFVLDPLLTTFFLTCLRNIQVYIFDETRLLNKYIYICICLNKTTLQYHQ